MNPALCFLLVALAGQAGPDPAAALAKTLLDSAGWELKPIPGGGVSRGALAHQAHCDAKEIHNTDIAWGNEEIRALEIGFVGKSSHPCDSPTQVSKLVTLPRTLRLSFMISSCHVHGAEPQAFLRFVDPESGRTLHSRDLSDGNNDLAISSQHEILLRVDRPRDLRIVIDTTCRTVLQLTRFSSASEAPAALPEIERAAIGRLVEEFRSDDPGQRDIAQKALASMQARRGSELALLDEIEGLRRKYEDAEVRARIDSVIAGSRKIVADLRAGP